jgi:uncharacterized protein YcfJ
MKQSILFAAVGLAALGAAAQEVAHVVSTVPVVQQVAVPRQNCVPGVVAMQPQTSGGGGLLGGIAGAAIGSTIGGGSGTAAAMLLGTVGGALLGNHIEANDIRAQQQAMPHCVTETTYENRTVAYNVTYEYAGRQHTVQMPYDPGPTVQLQAPQVVQSSPAPLVGGAVTAPPVQAGVPIVVPQPIAVAPYPTYPAYPVYSYPAYPVYPAYYRPPVSLSLGFVIGGHRHHGHRHHGGHRHHRR